MSSNFRYKGYEAHVSYDPGQRIFTGMVIGIRDGIIFEADSLAAVEPAFHEAVDDYLAFCEAKTKRPETATCKKSESGRISLSPVRAASR